MVVSSKWQSSIGIAGQCGQIVGLYATGFISDRIGYKKTMICSLIMMMGMVCIDFFSKNIQTFLIGAALQGVPAGAFEACRLTDLLDIMKY